MSIPRHPQHPWSNPQTLVPSALRPRTVAQVVPRQSAALLSRVPVTLPHTVVICLGPSPRTGPRNTARDRICSLWLHEGDQPVDTPRPTRTLSTVGLLPSAPGWEPRAPNPGLGLRIVGGPKGSRGQGRCSWGHLDHLPTLPSIHPFVHPLPPPLPTVHQVTGSWLPCLFSRPLSIPEEANPVSSHQAHGPFLLLPFTPHAGSLRQLRRSAPAAFTDDDWALPCPCPLCVQVRWLLLSSSLPALPTSSWNACLALTALACPRVPANPSFLALSRGSPKRSAIWLSVGRKVLLRP